MTCAQAVIQKVTILSPDQTVEEALDTLEKKKIRTAPVLDDDGKLLGMFGFHSLLTNLLPVSVTMDDGLQRLDFVIGAAPGVAKRLRKLKPQKLENIMDRKAVVVQPETPIWEAIRVIVKHGSPLPVVDEGSGMFVGLITEQSAIEELEKSDEELQATLKKELEEQK